MCPVSKRISKVSKKPTAKACKEEALRIWAKCIKTRDRICRKCGSDFQLTAHHIRGVKNNATMFDIENGITLCWRCHSIQKWNPELFQDHALDIIGEQAYAILKQKSRVAIKLGIADYLAEKERLEKQLAKLENDYGKL